MSAYIYALLPARQTSLSNHGSGPCKRAKALVVVLLRSTCRSVSFLSCCPFSISVHCYFVCCFPFNTVSPQALLHCPSSEARRCLPPIFFQESAGTITSGLR
jgi:hypothetical protein